MTKTALLLNDTSNAYHWGCFGTSTEIHHQLRERGYRVTSLGVAEVHGLKTPPRNSSQMSDPGFQRVFLADNPDLVQKFNDADIVIVNGEGTLHGLAQPAFNLLYLINLAKKAFNKPVYAINLSLYPSNADPADRDAEMLYATLLASVDRIVVRESRSHKIAKRLGLDAVLGFDCLPLYLKRMDAKSAAKTNGPIVVGGGLGLSPDSFTKIIDAISIEFGSHSLRYITGAPAHPALDDAPLLEAALATAPKLEHFVALSFEDWFGAVNNAACLVSGRFHHTIAAAFLNTPVVTFQAGTPKLDALCDSLSLSEPMSWSQDGTVERAVQGVAQAISSGEPVIADSVREARLQDSAKNFKNL